MFRTADSQCDSAEIGEDLTQETLKDELLPSTYGDLLITYLQFLGVDVVFGVPGGAIEPLFNALARGQNRGGPRVVVARHECGAAFMADGYFRETGKIGVVCTTTGPGATNLLTGVASAYLEEVPMLIITAQTPLAKFGKKALQESSCTSVDTVGMFRHVTRFNTLISHHEQFESKLISAILAANNEVCGPAHISVPSDIFRAPAETHYHIPGRLLTKRFKGLDEAVVEKLEDQLRRADNIVVYIGAGVGQASQQVFEFVDLIGAPFVAEPASKGWVNEMHPLYCGVYGFAGHDSARALLQHEGVELVIAVGASLGELGTSGWSQELLNPKLVHIDSIVEHFSRSSMANLHVYGNIDEIFSRLIRYVRSEKKWGRQRDVAGGGNGVANGVIGGGLSLKEAEKCVSNDTPIKPQRLMYLLSQILPSGIRVHVDAGNAWSWATHYFNRQEMAGHYRVAMEFGSMTWAIGASVGSAVGRENSPTLCIVGDGSYLMGAQEITVAFQQRLNVVFLVLNDSALGMVMHGQRLGGQESIGWELNRVDYAAMAQSMGIAGVVVDHPAQLEAMDWSELFTRDSPTLLDVRIDRNEVPPMGDRIKALAVDSSATPGG